MIPTKLLRTFGALGNCLICLAIQLALIIRRERKEEKERKRKGGVGAGEEKERKRKGGVGAGEENRKRKKTRRKKI